MLSDMGREMKRMKNLHVKESPWRGGALPECNATAHAGRMLLKHRLFSTLNFYGCNKSEFKVVKRSSRSSATESIVVVHQYEN